MDPKLVALLQKLEADGLADLKTLLLPAIVAEVIALSPASLKSVEADIFAVIQPAVQSALESLLAKVPVVA